MRRGELYLVKKPGSQDPRRQRVYLIVSRQALVDTRFSTVICAPIYSRHDGLSTQVQIGVAEGLKQESSVHCDELVSLSKAVLTHFVGQLSSTRMREVDRALAIALGIEDALQHPAETLQ